MESVLAAWRENISPPFILPVPEWLLGSHKHMCRCCSHVTSLLMFYVLNTLQFQNKIRLGQDLCVGAHSWGPSMTIQWEVPFVHQKALEIHGNEIKYGKCRYNKYGILRLVFNSLCIKEIKTNLTQYKIFFLVLWGHFVYTVGQFYCHLTLLLSSSRFLLKDILKGTYQTENGHDIQV